MKISNAAKVGLVASLAFVLVLVGIGILKGDLFIRGTRLVALYDNVEGLSTSDPVLIKGLKVGKVDEIGFLPGDVNKLYVRFHVHNGIDIPAGSSAWIISSDLLGSKAIEIRPDPGKRIVQSGDTLTGKTERGLSFDMKVVDSLLGNVVTKMFDSSQENRPEEKLDFNK